MGQTEFSDIEYADGTDSANIATVSLNLARDVDKFLGVFPTEAARNTAKTAYLAVSGRVADDALGMRCYITSRAGYCFWRGDKWVWESTHDLVGDQHWSGPGGINNLGTGALLTATFTLPGTGLRRLHVTAGVNLTGQNGAGGARAAVTGTGIASGEGFLQSWVDWVASTGDKYRQSVSRDWYVTASGAQTYQMTGTVEGSASFMYAGNMSLQVVDLGPSD